MVKFLRTSWCAVLPREGHIPMALQDWIKDASDKIRETIERVMPPQPQRVPATIPIPVYPPRRPR